MSDIDPEYLKHQYLYVPWLDDLDSFGAGKALALYVAHHFHARLTVVCRRSRTPRITMSSPSCRS